MMNDRNVYINNEDPDNVYYTCDVIPDQSQFSTLYQLQFSENLIEPLINDISNFEMSIVKLQADISTLPVFIPILDTTVNDGETTIYWIQLAINDGSGSASMTTALKFESFPVVGNLIPTVTDQFSNPKYWLHTFGAFCDMVNSAISASYANILDQLPGFTTKQPVLTYDSSAGKFNINFNVVDGETMTLFFNSPLALLLKHFKYSYGGNNADGGNYYQINYNTFGLNTITNAGATYYVLPQEYPSTDVFSPISAIVFTTTSLPIVGENVSVPKSLTNSALSASSRNSQERIITDINLSDAYDYKGVIFYSPSQYRFLTLIGQDLKSFNFSVSWKCRYNGKTYACYMPPNGFASIKLLFKKK